MRMTALPQVQVGVLGRPLFSCHSRVRGTSPRPSQTEQGAPRHSCSPPRPRRCWEAPPPAVRFTRAPTRLGLNVHGRRLLPFLVLFRRVVHRLQHDDFPCTCHPLPLQFRLVFGDSRDLPAFRPPPLTAWYWRSTTRTPDTPTQLPAGTARALLCGCPPGLDGGGAAVEVLGQNVYSTALSLTDMTLYNNTSQDDSLLCDTLCPQPWCLSLLLRWLPLQEGLEAACACDPLAWAGGSGGALTIAVEATAVLSYTTVVADGLLANMNSISGTLLLYAACVAVVCPHTAPSAHPTSAPTESPVRLLNCACRLRTRWHVHHSAKWLGQRVPQQHHTHCELRGAVQRGKYVPHPTPHTPRPGGTPV